MVKDLFYAHLMGVYDFLFFFQNEKKPDLYRQFSIFLNYAQNHINRHIFVNISHNAMFNGLFDR